MVKSEYNILDKYTSNSHHRLLCIGPHLFLIRPCDLRRHEGLSIYHLNSLLRLLDSEDC